jgi:hypothetical protein
MQVGRQTEYSQGTCGFEDSGHTDGDLALLPKVPPQSINQCTSMEVNVKPNTEFWLNRNALCA